ncbi:MAG: hypothetical protein AAB642_00210 [Patescibacteria group bacterium]
MTETGEDLQQKEEERVMVQSELGDIGPDSKEPTPSGQEIFASEVIKQLEMERRWEVILGPIGVI